MPTVIVLDINGVLADVRRPGTHRVFTRQTPDVFTGNSRQPVYFRPWLSQFFQGLRQISRDTGAIVITWTSRTPENAEPIERAFDSMGLVVAMHLHGDDCMYKVGFRHMKDATTVRLKCGLSGNSTILFCDDNPERVLGGTVVPVETYDIVSDSNDHVLQDLLIELKRLVH